MSDSGRRCPDRCPCVPTSFISPTTTRRGAGARRGNDSSAYDSRSRRWRRWPRLDTRRLWWIARTRYGTSRIPNSHDRTRHRCGTSRPSPSAPTIVASTLCRSEEHTSELQSHLTLVCRLLLQKKKKKRNATFSNKKKKITERRLDA